MLCRHFAVAILMLTIGSSTAFADEPGSPATAPAAAPAPQEKPLIFGLQRTVSGEEATKQAAIVEGYFTDALKHPLKTKIFATYDDLADALSAGTIDVGWINPLPFVRAMQAQGGITAVAKAIRQGSSRYQSVIFVKASSPAKTLADLKGSKAAWIDKDSASGYLYPRLLFVKAGVDVSTNFGTERFYGTHKAVCEAVLAGDADFGATFETGAENKELRPDGCLTSLGDSVKDKLRGIAASDGIPNEVVAVRAGFSPDMADSLGSVFGQMSQTEAGRKILTEVFNAEGFGAVLETDFDSVLEVLKAVSNGPLKPAGAAGDPAAKPDKKAHDKKPKKKIIEKAKPADQ